MTIDPKWRFIIGLIVTTAIGISQGAVQLTHAIPGDWIPTAVAWCGIIAFVGSAATTTISGFGMSNQNRLASMDAVPLDQKLDHLVASNPTQVKAILTTPAVADATNSERVVATIQAAQAVTAKAA